MVKGLYHLLIKETVKERAPMLSIIVPTYNEKENIPELIKRIFKVLGENNIDGEVVIVDDNSPDGTAKFAEELSKDYNVRVIVRKDERGLSSAAIRRMEDAKGEILCVIDADRQYLSLNLHASRVRA